MKRTKKAKEEVGEMELDIDYESDLEIDIDNLDQEWMNQPILFERYSTLHRQAVKEHARSWENLKSIRSELILEANEKGDMVLGKGIKVNMQTVEAYYRTHTKYKKAKAKAIELEYIANVLQDAVNAFRMRKNTLENLVQLSMMQYFSAPKEPKNAQREWSKQVEKARQGRVQKRIAKALNKNK